LSITSTTMLRPDLMTWTESPSLNLLSIAAPLSRLEAPMIGVVFALAGSREDRPAVLTAEPLRGSLRSRPPPPPRGPDSCSATYGAQNPGGSSRCRRLLPGFPQFPDRFFPSPPRSDTVLHDGTSSRPAKGV